MDRQSFGILFFRIGIGAIMALKHGLPKLLNFSSMVKTFPDPLHLGKSVSLALCISAEFFCALLIALGLFTRLASIPIIINMAIAFFIIHGADPFIKKELALIYLVSFVSIFFMGPGRYSADNLFRGVHK